MNNRWNRIVYRVWSPIYDRFFYSGGFLKARQQVFSDIVFSEGQKILFVGIRPLISMCFDGRKRICTSKNRA